MAPCPLMAPRPLDRRLLALSLTLGAAPMYGSHASNIEPEKIRAITEQIIRMLQAAVRDHSHLIVAIIATPIP